jgi:hypothetical protein
MDLTRSGPAWKDEGRPESPPAGAHLAPRSCLVPAGQDQELGRLPWLAFRFLRARLLLPLFAMSRLLSQLPSPHT